MHRRQILAWGLGFFGFVGFNVISAHNLASHSSEFFLPPKGDARIIVISDLNSQYGSTSYDPEVSKAIALIPRWQPDLVLCGGDMIAGQKSSLTPSQINAMWASFEQQIMLPLVSAKIPFGFTIGNHDGSGAIAEGQLTYQQERDLASAYWQKSVKKLDLNFIDRQNFPFYYSFIEKDIFYLVWDASTHLISQEQLVWVEQQLQSPQAQNAKLRMVIGHLPLYGIAVKRDKFGEFLSESENLRRLLEKYQVHTYISGHQHAYYPAKKGNLELLHAGALGSGPRQLLQSDLAPRKTLTVVDINIHQLTTLYTTYDLQTLDVIELKSLPSSIDTPTGRIWRRDINFPSNIRL